MHSLNHIALARYEVADRVRSAGRLDRAVVPPERPPRPPRVRPRLAYRVARAAMRVDREAARRAVRA